MGDLYDWASRSGVEHRLAPRVRIVADSASDILPRHAQAIGIIVVPNRIVLDRSVLRDGIDITPSQFYVRLPHALSPPYTEPASAQDLYSAYQIAFQQGATDILSIHVSSRLSKVVEHAMAAREHLAPAAIQVIDSRQAGIGMWPAVIRASQIASMGAPIQDVYNMAQAILARTRVYFMVETLEYLRRSGRIGRAQELIGTLFDAHPILTIHNGEVAPVETARPRGRALQRMRELMLSSGGTIDSLLVCGTSIESIAQMEVLLSEWYPGAIQKTWLGPTLGANTGPAVAAAVVVR
jgi:DegV family protein with EDD domain